jgi:hypothetical protein
MQRSLAFQHFTVGGDELDGLYVSLSMWAWFFLLIHVHFHRDPIQIWSGGGVVGVGVISCFVIAAEGVEGVLHVLWAEATSFAIVIIH